MDAGTHGGRPEENGGHGNHQSGDDTAHAKKNECSPWLRKMWCITAITEQDRERMYKILELYATAYGKDFPVVYVEEKSKQLIKDTRNAIPLKHGSMENTTMNKGGTEPETSLWPWRPWRKR